MDPSANLAFAASDGNKRKFESYPTSLQQPDLKRVQAGSAVPPVVAVSTLLAGLASGNGQALSGVQIQGAEVTDLYPCPSDKVGKVIGKQGAHIKDLMARSSCTIRVDLTVQGELKNVVITGSRENVDKAKKMVEEMINSEAPTFKKEGDMMKVMEVDTKAVGRIIGRGGDNIKTLQAASGVRIAIKNKEAGTELQRVEITGKEELVERAYKMVEELAAIEEPGNVNAAVQKVIDKHCGSITKSLECPKAIVGRIIGRGGETIKGIQRHFGARIQVEEGSEGKSKVTITGPINSIEGAERAVKDIIEGKEDDRRPPPGGFPPPYVGPPGPYSGPPGPYSGPPPPYGAPYPPPGSYYPPPAGYFPPHGGYQPPPPEHYRPPAYNPPPPGGAGYNPPPSGAPTYTPPPAAGGAPSYAAPSQAPYPGPQGTDPYAAAPGGNNYSAPASGAYPTYQSPAPPAQKDNSGPVSYGGGPASTSHPGGYGQPQGGQQQQQPQQQNYNTGAQVSPYSSMYGQNAGAAQQSQPSYGASQPAATAAAQPSYGVPAPAPVQAASPWMELRDDTGRVYYYNPTTSVSQWDKPAGMP